MKSSKADASCLEVKAEVEAVAPEARVVEMPETGVCVWEDVCEGSSVHSSQKTRGVVQLSFHSRQACVRVLTLIKESHILYTKQLRLFEEKVKIKRCQR